MSALAALLGLAGQNLASGRAVDAMRLLDQAMADHSADRSLLALRAQAFFALGDRVGAAAAMASIVAQGPAEAETLLALGLFLDAAKATRSAGNAFIHAGLARPGFGRPALAQALIRLRAGDPVPAMQLIRTAGIGTAAADRRNLEIRLMDALRDMRPADLEALEDIAEHPDFDAIPLAIQIRVDAALRCGAQEEAGARLDRLARLRPDWPGLTRQRALAAFSLCDWTGTVGHLPADEMMPTHLRLIRATALARSGKSDEASAALETLASAEEATTADRLAARVLIARKGLADGRSPTGVADTGDTGDAVSALRPFDHRSFDRLLNKAELHRAIKDLTDAQGQAAFADYPETYLLPQEATAAGDAADGNWIVKSPDGREDPILINGTADWDVDHPTVIQRLIQDPLLINGRKATVLLFLILPDPDPNHALLFEDGLVQFAPDPLEETAGGHVLRPAQIITSPRLSIGSAGYDPTLPDHNPAAVIWSLKSYIGEISRLRGVRAGGLAWNNLARIARAVGRLVDHAGMMAAWRATPAPWSFPPKVIRIDAVLDSDFRAHLLDLGGPVPARFAGRAGKTVLTKLDRTLVANATEGRTDMTVALHLPT